ncbi:MAG: hypothetical protein FWG64_11955 [Firmicutes bacterium]|nr:hypothetical protein [Bacillota bacterium]
MAQQVTLNITTEKDIVESAESLFTSLGFTISDAINAFFRQAVRKQAMPFVEEPEIIDYTKDDPYFTPEILARLAESEENFRNGRTISFTMEELRAMETGEIPQRAIDFENKYKQAENLS